MDIKLENNWKKNCYTIVEMMMVIAVFMIILSMAMAAWMNSGDQANLKNAARLVNAQLNLARAKAAADCRSISVVFTYDSSSQKTKLEMCFDTAGNKKVPNEAPYYLPGNIFFAEKLASGMNTAKTPNRFVNGNNLNKFGPGEITYNANGGCNTVDPLYITAGTGSGKFESGQSYFILDVNSFTGRTKTIHAEVE